jgi:hypothetical protein
MKTSILAAGAMLIALALPAHAQTMTCDEATMTKWKTGIDGMSDEAMKTEHMKSYDTAMAAMKANKMDECNKALNDTMSRMNNDSQGSKDSGTTTN